MELYRLTAASWARDLTGKGAAYKGARWNSPGTEIIYTASNRSLAMAEVAVHFTLATMPSDYMMVTIFVPDDTSMKIIQVKELPVRWNSFPYISDTQRFGDEFVNENRYCLLKLPSAVTKGDFNILMNPLHAEFKAVRIISTEHFPFDERIFKK